MFPSCSHRQLQSLVARTQCGDLLHVLISLLQDRQQLASTPEEREEEGEKEEEEEEDRGKEDERKRRWRSVYRETLFLKCVTQEENIDVGEASK